MIGERDRKVCSPEMFVLVSMGSMAFAGSAIGSTALPLLSMHTWENMLYDVNAL